MFKQREFEQYAELCFRMLEDGDVPRTHRDGVERMARVWLQMAIEEARIAEFVGVLDGLMARDVGRHGTRADRRLRHGSGAVLH